MKESDAFVLMPGGYGTMDEAFELLTLMQTGKTAIRPVVLLEPRRQRVLGEWMAFVREHLVDRGLASPEDLSLFELADGIADCDRRSIERFYSNYDSARYVGERLVLRHEARAGAGAARAPEPRVRRRRRRGRIEAIGDHAGGVARRRRRRHGTHRVRGDARTSAASASSSTR